MQWYFKCSSYPWVVGTLFLNACNVIFHVFTHLFCPALPASSLITFLQPAYSHSRFDKVAKIPVLREIIDNGKSQVTYRTRDLTAKDGRVRTMLLSLAGRNEQTPRKEPTPGLQEN